MEKLIITAAICGAEVTKAQNEAVPYTVEEMVREAKSAYEAGAAILHIHVREDDGTPTQDRERFKVVMDAIRKELPDVIMIPSTGGATGTTLSPSTSALSWATSTPFSAWLRRVRSPATPCSLTSSWACTAALPLPWRTWPSLPARSPQALPGPCPV